MEVSPIQDGGESNLLEKIPEIESNHDDNGIPADVINKGESSSVSTGEPKLATDNRTFESSSDDVYRSITRVRDVR